MHLEAHSSVNEHGAFIYEAVRTLYENADPGPRDLCVCAMDKFTGIPSPVEEKGQQGHSLKR